MIDRFTQDFEQNLSMEITREETFNRAKKKFEETCGFTPYRSYRSYQAARSRDKRKFR